jgi:quercetin dioxygenase-like cupin family protein
MTADIVVACDELEVAREALARRGFVLDRIYPADDPAVMVVVGHGLRIRLVRDGAAPRTVRIALAEGATEVVVAGTTRIELVPVEPLVVPALVPAFAVTRATDAWRTGRAGMQYRDLIPGRLGGRHIASHIRIVDGGPVPDYVHHHLIRYQLIYCHRGWVRVVYEDQGEPFVMRAGDCVVQPPEIRHRVLECSPGLEVIEVGSPAVHETRVDHALALPTAERRDRAYGGQRFAWHRATPGPRDLGVAAATGGAAGAHVRAGAAAARSHDGELLFGFVLEGECALVADTEGEHRLGPADAFVIPAGRRFALERSSSDFAWLEIAAPA